jgi:hypothetical protein
MQSSTEVRGQHAGDAVVMELPFGPASPDDRPQETYVSSRIGDTRQVSTVSAPGALANGRNRIA